MYLSNETVKAIKEQYGFSADRIIRCLGKARDDMKIYEDYENRVLIPIETMEKKIKKYDSFTQEIAEATTIRELGHKILNNMGIDWVKNIDNVEIRELLSYCRYSYLEQIEEIIKELKEIKKNDHFKKLLEEKKSDLVRCIRKKNDLEQSAEREKREIASMERDIKEQQQQLARKIHVREHTVSRITEEESKIETLEKEIEEINKMLQDDAQPKSDSPTTEERGLMVIHHPMVMEDDRLGNIITKQIEMMAS